MTDLLKIYDRSAVKDHIYKKSKTEGGEIYNPEQKPINESNKSNLAPFSLPQIQKTSNIKKAKEEYNRLMYDNSSRVLPVYGSLV